MMKAIVLNGVNEPLENSHREIPEPQNGEYLIRLKAAALNRRDFWIQKGMYAGLKFPIILGSDGAGTIEKAGPGTDAGRVGTNVLINPSHDWGTNHRVQGSDYHILGLPEDGTFREYITIPAKYVHAMPAHLSFEEAAAIPLAGLTAFRALFSRARLQAGEKVLITGAGGGVSQFALAFALAAGAEVWVTSGSEEKIAAAVERGAKGGANYKFEGWDKDLKSRSGEFNVIVDSAGGKGFGSLVKIAAPGGRIVLYGGTAGPWEKVSPQIVFWKQLDILGTTMGNDEDFQDMIDFVAANEIKPEVSQVFPLDEAQAAMQYMAEGKQFGKIVLSI